MLKRPKPSSIYSTRFLLAFEANLPIAVLSAGAAAELRSAARAEVLSACGPAQENWFYDLLRSDATKMLDKNHSCTALWWKWKEICFTPTPNTADRGFFIPILSHHSVAVVLYYKRVKVSCSVIISLLQQRKEKLTQGASP
jgi:hypothetical protein